MNGNDMPRRRRPSTSSPRQGAPLRALTLLLLAAASCLGLGLALGTAAAAPSANPFLGATWYVDDHIAVAQAERAAQSSRQSQLAANLDVIARTPQSMWFIAADDPRSSSYVHGFFTRSAAAQPNGIIFITLHGLPKQVCAGDNAPGSAGIAEYRSWIDGYAQLIGARRAVAFLEPDALAAARCLSAADQSARLRLMTYAARTLSALPHTGVYEDAGAGDWRTVSDTVALLRAAGVRYARGFALNATHYDWTAAEISYGLKVSRRLRGKHFVVNTAFNGRGPQITGHGFHEWCNPSGRALGPLPTVNTPRRAVDALFWIGNPGLSDGHCNGGPTVGELWPDWAAALVGATAGAADFPLLRRR